MSACVLNGSFVEAKCGHYSSCNECRCRLVQLLLRCSSCCLDLTGEFPVCGDSCEKNSKQLSQSLRVASCPRCHLKLSKQTCGSSCSRVTSASYKQAEARLRERVGALVLEPSFSEKPGYEGERPCSHFTKCQEHGRITRGRSFVPRCPQCKNKVQQTEPKKFCFVLESTGAQFTPFPTRLS